MARHSRRKSFRSTRNYGAERAREHIVAAQRLTMELGGADKEVKDWLFGLPSYELVRILDAYGKGFGESAREYAERTIPKWKSGQVQMGGMVAERLFKILPIFMPLAIKYKLTEGLWRHFGPSSSRTIWIGLDADPGGVREAARAHFEDKASAFRIPSSMEDRFEWISADDVGVKQDLLNHLRDMEKQLVSDALTIQLPMLFEHLRNDDAGYTKRVDHVLKVGKHELHMVIDKRATGIQNASPRSASDEHAWVWWVAGALAVAFFFIVRK